MLSDFDLRRKEKLFWREFFTIFSELREKIETDKKTSMRSTWHPATLSYEMSKVDSTNTNANDFSEQLQIPDDHTDDDLSDNGDNDKNDDNNYVTDESKFDGRKIRYEKKKIYREGWNSEYVSPIFFGYSTLQTSAVEFERTQQDEERHRAEQLAVENARSSRLANLDSFVAATKSQQNMRLKRIIDLEKSYVSAQAKREEDLAQNQKYLAPSNFRLYKVCDTINFSTFQLFVYLK